MILRSECRATMSMCPRQEPLQAVEGESHAASCDGCPAPILRALRAGGIRTVASCCGHYHMPPVITLADGSHLVIWERPLGEVEAAAAALEDGRIE